MRICPKCNEPIGPFEPIRFISGVTVLDQDGDFVISEEVFENCVIYHEECLKPTYRHPKVLLIKKILQLDQKTNYLEVEKFVDLNLEKTDQEIISSWFKRY